MDKPYCFSIGVDRGLYNFSASSGSMRMSWVNQMRNAIRIQLKIFREQTLQKGAAELTNKSKASQTKNKRSSGMDPVDKPIDKIKEKKGKKDRVKGKKYIKNGVMYKEQDSGYFKKYNAFLKEGFLILAKEKDKKDQVSYDLLLCSVSSTIKEVKTKDSGITLYTAEFVSELRRDILGTESKEDLEEWLLYTKSAQDDLGRVSKKKKKIINILKN